MNIYELLDNMCSNIQSNDDALIIYKDCIKYLTENKVFRGTAAYLGSLSIDRDLFEFTTFDEFKERYLNICIGAMRSILNADNKISKDDIITNAFNIIFAYLQFYVSNIDYKDKELNNLIEDNNELYVGK